MSKSRVYRPAFFGGCADGYDFFWVWQCAAGYSEEDIERRFRLDLVAMHEGRESK